MTDKSGQTRKSFLESMKGKAKEWTGALTGRDSLTAEGQLEQAGARRRRQASRLQAESDLEQRDAAARAAASIANRKGHGTRPRSARRAREHRDRASCPRRRGARRERQAAAHAALPPIVGSDDNVAA